MANKQVDYETESMIDSVLFGEKSQYGGSNRPASVAYSRTSKTAAKPSARYMANTKPAQDKTSR